MQENTFFYPHKCTTNTLGILLHTLVYQKEVQVQINVQVGEFLKINKCAIRNKRAGATSCKQLLNVRDLIDVQ